MKKLISILLAVAMIMSFALVVSADTLPDLDCEYKRDEAGNLVYDENGNPITWWLAHTDGIEVKSGEIVTINFTNTTYAGAPGNWNGPLYVLYTGSEAKVNGADYVEYWVQRGDAWGWGSATAPEYTFADGFDWANYLPNLLAGPIDGVITASLVDTTLTITLEFNGVTAVQTTTVDSTAPVYLSLTGELTTLSNITYSYTAIETDTGSDDTTGDTTTPDAGETTTPSEPATGGDTTTEEPSTGATEGTTATTPSTSTDSSYTLSDLDCSGWWAAHSEGIEVTEDGVVVTFTSTTYETAANNWNGPLWVLYTGDEAKVNGAGYLEYWVQRVDNYGWCVLGQYYNADLNRWSGDDALAAYGISVTTTEEEGCWDNFLANLKAGVEVTVSAQLAGTNAVVTMSAAGVTTTVTLPVDTSKPVYLSLTGELNTITDIDVIPNTGDTTNLIALGAAMILAVAGVATVTVSKKKFF